MLYKYIFWDNDGVLVDTERFYMQASKEALSRLDIELSSQQFASISLGEGRSIFDLAKGVDDATINKLKEWRNKRYSQLLQSKDIEVEGAARTLLALSGNVFMAIVTSSLRQHFNIIHKRTGFLNYMDFFLTREDYKKGKPSGESYLLALKQSGVNAEEVLVIEDSPRGLAAAKEAGLACWVVPNTFADEESFRSADKILNGIEDILSHLY